MDSIGRDDRRGFAVPRISAGRGCNRRSRYGGAAGIIERLVPAKAHLFLLEKIPAENGRDVFEIETRDGKVLLCGSSGVAIASGAVPETRLPLRCVLCGASSHLPDPLPLLEKKSTGSLLFPSATLFNYCAFSYTMAWWDWPQWERMIDWMALNGINLPLAVTGQEAVWHNVYRKLGLSEAEIGQFLVGPAYLPFGWMGCMDGWGGPLPQAGSEAPGTGAEDPGSPTPLGMTSVLQGFTGHVPGALKRIFPSGRLPPVAELVWLSRHVFCRSAGSVVSPGSARRSSRNRPGCTVPIISTPRTRSSRCRRLRIPSPGSCRTWVRRCSKPCCRDRSEGRLGHAGMALFINNPGFWKPPQSRALF